MFLALWALKPRKKIAKNKIPLKVYCNLNMFNLFAKHVDILKQCTNLRLHDKNYTSFVVALVVHKMGGGDGAG